jgi:energy-coupling factor transporter ATP-binding protein EcfA2
MMQLRRISLVQWHLFGRADLDLWGDTAILGTNRSGKSTLIDLIQLVMTGGSPRFYRFNRSAGEGGGRSDRTLRSYCLGQLSETHRLRKESVTHVALVFEDPEGARPPVSIGLCVEATLDEAQIVGKYIAPGISLDTSLLVETLEDGRLRSASWALARERLTQACKAAGTDLLLTDTARNHIRDYMRLLFTGRRASDPERFVRAFVLALSFEDMRSVEHFVHTYLLEPKDIEIGELRDSIRRYREIQRDIHELQKRLEALRAIQALIADFDCLLSLEETARGVARLASLIEAGDALLTTLAERRSKSETLQATSDDIARHDAEIERLKEEQEAVNAQLQASDQASQRAVVSTRLKLAEQERNTVAAQLQERFLNAARATTLLEQRDVLAPLKMGELMSALDAIKAESLNLVPPQWPKDPFAMERLLGQAATAATAQRSKVENRRNEAIRWRSEIEERLRSLNAERDQARSGRVALGERTQRLMDVLTKEGMRPRALCQVADVRDEGWRAAAEALLGRDREAILVDPEHASQAISILRGSRDAFGGCRVANTRRLADMPRNADAGTLASVLGSEDPLAMAFIVYRTGNIQLAETQDELLAGGRAIMRDGAYNSGIVVEVLRAQDFKIGLAAAPLMLEALRLKIETEQANLANHQSSERLHDDVLRRLEAMIVPVPDEQRLDRLAAKLDDLDEQLLSLQRSLDAITAMIDPALKAALDRLKSQLKALEDDKFDLVEERGGLRNALDEITAKLGGGDSLLGSWLCLKTRRRLFRERTGNLATFAPVRAAMEVLRPQPLARMVQQQTREADQAQAEYRDVEGQIREALGRYRVDFGGVGPSGPHIKILGDIKPWVDENVTALEENELIQYRRQADEAADQIGRLFRTAFVHELNSRFSAMRTDLENLGRALRARPLHNETYSLHWQVKPEFEALHRLARESEDDETTLNALFGRGAPRDEHQAQALREVERLLSDETLDFSLYQDYRKYFSFDLQMQDVSSGRKTSFDRRRGSASGAERQVPFYVVIGAALSSIYHGTRRQQDETALGLGLAVFDEAFSKMDGPNQRTLLEFYREIGLQVVIAAPTEKRSIVLENLECIVDVFRSGDDVSAESARIKHHAREQMRAANPQHLSDEDIAAKLRPQQADAAE